MNCSAALANARRNPDVVVDSDNISDSDVRSPQQQSYRHSDAMAASAEQQAASRRQSRAQRTRRMQRAWLANVRSLLWAKGHGLRRAQRHGVGREVEAAIAALDRGIEKLEAENDSQ